MRIIKLAIVSTITVEKQNSNKDKLSYLKDFNEMFEFVKSSVNSVYDMKRAGLSLMLHGMPTRIGAYHVLGSNVIAVNKLVLDLVRKYSTTNEEYNAYLFTVTFALDNSTLAPKRSNSSTVWPMRTANFIYRSAILHYFRQTKIGSTC